MTPQVSVVIATKNYARYLRETIQSVIDQTWTAWELIVIDDGSTDQTPQVVQPFLTDSRIRYVRTDGLGQARAKNLGIGLSQGFLIAFLDGDDQWLPNKLSQQIPLFDQAKVGVVYSQRVLIDDQNIERPDATRDCPRGDIFERVLLKNAICFSSVIVRRSVFDRVGSFDQRLDLAIDYDLWLRVAPHFYFDYVPTPLVRYRTGHANLSRRIVERIETIFSIIRRSVFRRGHATRVEPHALGRAWGDTHRSLAYSVRPQSRWASARQYLAAAYHDRRWLWTMKSLVGLVIPRAWRRKKST